MTVYRPQLLSGLHILPKTVEATEIEPETVEATAYADLIVPNATFGSGTFGTGIFDSQPPPLP